MSNLHIFIISWHGQHEKAALIANAIDGLADKLSIVSSGPEPAAFAPYKDRIIQRDDRLFWSDKFLACLFHCAPDDLMLVIHADCQCDDWSQVIERCRDAFARFDSIGIWSPRLTGTPWRLEKTRMQRLEGSECSIVAHTDGLVFALPPRIRLRMMEADYSHNLYGLGIDWMYICAAYAQGMVAIMDEAIIVRHSITRGYCSRDARQQKREFLKQLTPDEAAAHVRLKAHMRPRKLYAKIMYKLEGLAQRLRITRR